MKAFSKSPAVGTKLTASSKTKEKEKSLMVGSAIILQGTITGLKSAFNLIKGINKLQTMTEVNAVAIELQQMILTAQSDAAEAFAEQQIMLENIRELKEELASVKAWETEKQRYELKEIGRGALAYVLKEGMENGEPSHKICPACYQNSKKFILQRSQKSGEGIFSECPSCKARVYGV